MRRETKRVLWILGILGIPLLLAGIAETDKGNVPSRQKLKKSLVAYAKRSSSYEIREAEILFLENSEVFQAANNPAIRYGFLFVPCEAAYPDYPDNPAAYPCDRKCSEKNYTRRFTLLEHDAVLSFGWTVPSARYFNILAYQACRINAEGASEGTLSSIGLGLNHLTLKTAYGDPDPFRGFYGLIVTADRRTAEDLRGWMVSVGIPEEAVNVYYIPATFTGGDNTLNLLLRVIYPGDGAEAYMADPPVSNFLVRYHGDGVGRELVQEIPRWEDVVEPKTWEIDRVLTPNTPLKPDYMELFVQKIKETYEGREGCSLRADFRAEIRHKDPEYCRADPPHLGACLHDNPDAVFLGFPRQEGCSNEGDESSGWCLVRESEAREGLLVLAGVNHYLFENLAVDFFCHTLNRYSQADVDRLVGVESRLGEQALGSSHLYWSQDTQPVFLAERFAFDCDLDGDGEKDPYCVEIEPSEDPEATFYTVTGRIYLDEETGTGPHPDNFVPPRLLWFTGEGCLD